MAAPAAPRPDSPSPTNRYEVIQATTGSSMKINAVLAGEVYRCAQAITVKARAVASNPVISIAQTTAGRHVMRGVSIHENIAQARIPETAICVTANNRSSSFH